MATAPFLTLPASACFASVNITLKRVVSETASPFTLQEQSFKWPGEQWLLEFSMPPFTRRSIASEWIAFLAKLEGKYGRFLIGDPSAKVSQGSALGNPVVQGAGQLGNTLITSGWTPNSVNVLMQGDYIQLGSGLDSKLHMIVDNASSDGSGNANLSIVPAITQSPATASSIITQDAKGLFRLDSNDVSWSVAPGKIYRLSFNAKEVV